MDLLGQRLGLLWSMLSGIEMVAMIWKTLKIDDHPLHGVCACMRGERASLGQISPLPRQQLSGSTYKGRTHALTNPAKEGF